MLAHNNIVPLEGLCTIAIVKQHRIENLSRPTKYIQRPAANSRYASLGLNLDKIKLFVSSFKQSPI